MMNDNGCKLLGSRPSTGIMHGDELATVLDLTSGQSINADTDWLELSLNGETVYIPKKPLRCNVSYLDLMHLHDRTVEHDGGAVTVSLIQPTTWDVILTLLLKEYTLDDLGVYNFSHGSICWLKSSNDDIGMIVGTSSKHPRYDSDPTIKSMLRGWRPIVKFDYV